MLLAIDTSTETASVALAAEGELRCELSWVAGQNHVSELMPAIMAVLAQRRAGFNDLSALGVAIGPGSFNGVRVAVGTAKGLALALKIPAYGVSTLEVEAWAHAPCGGDICALADAGRGEVATALFSARGGWRRIAEEHITTVVALAREAPDDALFCGRITPRVLSELRDVFGEGVRVARGAAGLRRAGYLAELAWRRVQMGAPDEAPEMQPLYLRRPAITLHKFME